METVIQVILYLMYNYGGKEKIGEVSRSRAPDPKTH